MPSAFLQDTDYADETNGKRINHCPLIKIRANPLHPLHPCPLLNLTSKEYTSFSRRRKGKSVPSSIIRANPFYPCHPCPLFWISQKGKRKAPQVADFPLAGLLINTAW
jgi:hypothetical protein